MRQFGYDLEITRGESTYAEYTFVDQSGQPFRLPTLDTYAFLQIHFKVKENPYGPSLSTYIIDKIFDINTLKRFSDITILNLEDYDPLVYNPLLWPTSAPATADIDRLFYHHDLKEYKYYDVSTSAWVPYSFTLSVPFTPSDTENLFYKTYVYDIFLEAGDTIGVIDFAHQLVPQHKFTVSYRV